MIHRKCRHTVLIFFKVPSSASVIGTLKVNIMADNATALIFGPSCLSEYLGSVTNLFLSSCYPLI